MFIFDIFRSFLPLRNPIGFGASDFIELTLAIVLLALALGSRAWIEAKARVFAERTGWCMLLLGLLPIALRLLLLRNQPIPAPAVSDDFSYLLLADTLAHLRLANPTHPLHQFFETFFTLQEPSYSSMFPMGQGLILAFGQVIFGHPWAGVAISIGAFSALCYWMLRAWTTPGWALLAGIYAALQFGALSQWMNSYWGGAVSAAAGCLVFGSLPRLRETGRTRAAILLGLGLALQLLTRPFESMFLVVSVALYFLIARLGVTRTMLLAPAMILPAVILMLCQNKAVTGRWTTLPYQLSQYQYGVPGTFTIQPNPIPHRELTTQQQMAYDIQADLHGKGTDTLAAFLQRYANRVRFYRFFLLVPLYFAIPFFLIQLRKLLFAWILVTVLLFSVGTTFYPYFYSHYIAAITCLLILICVLGLNRMGPQFSRLILFLCAVHFIFWYGVHALGKESFLPTITQFETWDAINSGDPEGRIEITQALNQRPGRQLVFVRYWPRHTFQEWVHNGADIDASQIVWARDLGEVEDEKLIRYYPDRTAWVLEPDARPPRLTRLNAP